MRREASSVRQRLRPKVRAQGLDMSCHSRRRFSQQGFQIGLPDVAFHSYVRKELGIDGLCVGLAACSCRNKETVKRNASPCGILCASRSSRLLRASRENTTIAVAPMATFVHQLLPRAPADAWPVAIRLLSAPQARSSESAPLDARDEDKNPPILSCSFAMKHSRRQH